MSKAKGGFTSFQVECEAAHNDYRAKHKVPSLKLDSALCKFAQEWADDLARRSVMQHRSQSKYGENIYYFQSSDPNQVVRGRDAVDSWYSEIKQYVFGCEPRSTGTGHFTQVVWKGSKELGVGMAKNKNGQVFVVANYDPPGNFLGQYAKNVPPTGGF